MENKLVVIEIDHLFSLIKQALNEELIKREKSEKQKDLLNFRETCEFLGIHPSTLNKWKAKNKVPYKRLGKRIFFQREEILNSLKESNYYKLKKIYSQYN
ncbi:MAG: helix-turn-helix domain-containing protein [Ignavibacteriae bacterium]|nr:helix-turn-helix domain-containing protein [Ignavibacteriota bacterium]